MSGHASHRSPRIVHDIDLSKFDLSVAKAERSSRLREYFDAVNREMAHVERRDGKEAHLPPVPKEGK